MTDRQLNNKMAAKLLADWKWHKSNPKRGMYLAQLAKARASKPEVAKKRKEIREKDTRKQQKIQQIEARKRKEEERQKQEDKQARELERMSKIKRAKKKKQKQVKPKKKQAQANTTLFDEPEVSSVKDSYRRRRGTRVRRKPKK